MSNTSSIAKPRVDRTKYMFTDKNDQILIKKFGELEGFNFKIRNLNNCKVYLLDWTTGIFVDDCSNCEFFIGPCDGSVFIRTSKNCKISIISKQLRFRECHDCYIYTYCCSDPVIEASSNIIFGPFNYLFPNAKNLFIKAGFNHGENNYDRVYDFSENNNQDNVHWRLIQRGEFKEEIISLSEINEQNELIYDSYRNEYINLLSEQVEEEQTNLNNVKERDSEEDYDYSSFINQDDIVNELNLSNTISNLNLLTENKPPEDDLNNYNKEEITSFKSETNETHLKFDTILKRKKDLKNKLKDYLESIRKENSICKNMLKNYENVTQDLKKKINLIQSDIYENNSSNHYFNEKELEIKKSLIFEKYLI